MLAQWLVSLKDESVAVRCFAAEKLVTSSPLLKVMIIRRRECIRYFCLVNYSWVGHDVILFAL